jgi:phospholipid/cholesterol/gamma-HCH transport system permease protein
MPARPASGPASPSPAPSDPAERIGSGTAGGRDGGAPLGTEAPDAEQEPPDRLEDAVGDMGRAIEDAGRIPVRLAFRALLGMLAYLGEVAVLLGQTVRSLRSGVHLGDLVRQMGVIGVDSIPIALLTTGFSGAVLALYSASTLNEYGAGNFVGGIVGLAIVRETAPILTGVVLTARSGSAMTAEIGSMKVTEQVDALRSMAVPPIWYLVLPRLLASLLMLPVVCVLADLIGIVGGGIVAQTQGVPWETYAQSLRQFLDPSGKDILQGLLKTVFFGAIIATVGCREGLQTEGGATGVGQSTTRSVVISIVLIFIANFFLSFLMLDQ